MSRRNRFFKVDDLRTRWAIATVAAIVFVYGVFWQHAALLGVGAVVLCLVLRRVGEQNEEDSPGPHYHSRRRHNDHNTANETPTKDVHTTSESNGLSRTSPSVPASAIGGQPKSTSALVDGLLATGRYALLLRPETKQHLSQHHIVRAIRELDEAMALVPAGRVLLGQLAEQSSSACGNSDADPKLLLRNLVKVQPVYLDRFAVSNEQYQEFVDAGGYEQLEFWQEEALPALLDFVDQTGSPGPRYWVDGQFPSGDQRLPVVGVSWYEAAAYARWVGKRLPSDAEWTKAGAWPVESAPGRIAQRRYPWGESFDVRRANLHASGGQGPLPVDELPGGTSVGGIHQLIGNVWEWTSTPLAELGDQSLHVSESVVSIRGGAFDTYFENQATCHYQSGEHPLSRRPNIGFRLALPMSDLEVTNEDDAPNDVVDEPVTHSPANEDACVAC